MRANLFLGSSYTRGFGQFACSAIDPITNPAEYRAKSELASRPLATLLSPEERTRELVRLLSEPDICFTCFVLRSSELVGRRIRLAELGICDDLLADEAEGGMPLPEEEILFRVRTLVRERAQSRQA